MMRTVGTYDLAARDRAEVFAPDQLVFVHFAGTYDFCAPATFRAPGSMTFQEFVEQLVRPWLGSWSTWADLDVSEAEFLLNLEPFEPAWDQALAKQGVVHKALLTIRPGR